MELHLFMRQREHPLAVHSSKVHSSSSGWAEPEAGNQELNLLSLTGSRSPEPEPGAQPRTRRARPMLGQRLASENLEADTT